MKILVIGGSGFIGTRLVQRLKEIGHSVRIFDKAMSGSFPDLVTLGDVCDPIAVADAMTDVDCIVNLAAEHRDDVHPISRYYSVNVGGAMNIVAAASSRGIEKIVFTSTVAVYGLEQPNASEAGVVTPFNDYGSSKAQAEEIFNAWVQQLSSKRSLVILRPVVIFGEGNRGNVFNLIEQIRRKRFVMVGDGNNRKSMAYVGNIVDFIVSRLGMAPGRYLYNYADKPDRTTAELIALIRASLGVPSSSFSLPYWIGLLAGYCFDAMAFLMRRTLPISSVRIRKFCANTQVATEALNRSGFTRPFTIEEGLDRMIKSMHIDDLRYWGEGGGA